MSIAAKHVAPELGIAQMDEEHRELTRLFNEFFNCIENGGCGCQINDIVSQAIERANAHFEHEEDMAVQAAYPGIEEEKFQHRNMRLQLTTLAGDTLANASRDPVTLGHLEDMRNILVEHMNGPDRELADYLKAAGFK